MSLKLNEGSAIFTREFLEEEYVKKRLSAREIAESSGSHKATVLYHLNKLGIETRYKPVDIPIGTVFGTWIVLEEHNEKARQPKFTIQCLDCGAIECIHKVTVKENMKILTRRCECFWDMNPHIVRASGKRHLWIKILTSRAARKRFDISDDMTSQVLRDKMIEQNCQCVLTGMPITEEYTGSVDRIDSQKGYLVDNFQWVHKDANVMKWDFEQEYFFKMCGKVVKLHG